LALGCGRGLVGILVGLFTSASESRWYLGVDRCDRYVRAARQALEDMPGCSVQTLDLRDFDPPPADVVVINDVLRFLPFTSQDALLRRLARALPAGARVFVREKDAAGGWRFRWAAFVDTMQMLVPGHPRHGNHYRRAGDLRNALIAAGFTLRDRTVARSSSPAWVLLEAVRRPAVTPRA
jgi:O-methyltransferase involved in polyketide biosynthesis